MNNIKELRDQVGKTQSDVIAAELGNHSGAVAHYGRTVANPGWTPVERLLLPLVVGGFSALSMMFPLRSDENHHDKTHQNNHESGGITPTFLTLLTPLIRMSRRYRHHRHARLMGQAPDHPEQQVSILLAKTTT